MSPFMSTAPRPWSRPPRISRLNGSVAQPSPGGTTSRWPAKPKCGDAVAARREHILDRPVGRLAGDEAVHRRSRAAPAPPRARRTPSRARGVTLGQAIRRRGKRRRGRLRGSCRRLASGACTGRDDMPKIDLDVDRADQPHRLSRRRSTRTCRAAGIAASRRRRGLTDFGVSHVVLKPGAWSRSATGMKARTSSW